MKFIYYAAALFAALMCQRAGASAICERGLVGDAESIAVVCHGAATAADLQAITACLEGITGPAMEVARLCRGVKNRSQAAGVVACVSRKADRSSEEIIAGCRVRPPVVPTDPCAAGRSEGAAANPLACFGRLPAIGLGH